MRYLKVTIKVHPDEKLAFEEAAAFAGISLSGWIRERLRKVAREELKAAGLPVAFLVNDAKRVREDASPSL
jgi:hypothetical protein